MISLAFALIIHAAPAHELGKHFERGSFKLGPKTLELWVADTEARRGRGLMYVDKLGADEGMLFVFEDVQPMSFWMKNTLIPLAIGFFDERCVLAEIVEMKVAASVLSPEIPTYRSHADAKFALEMNAGWFGGKIKPGTKLTPLAGKGRKRAPIICK